MSSSSNTRTSNPFFQMTQTEAPESTLPYPPIHIDKKFVILSDWDGTITTYDSNDYLTDHLGFGLEKRRQGNKDILNGKKTFRDGFREMLESVPNTFDECAEVLKQNIKLDEGFKDFFKWTKSADVPLIIVSSGMAPLIRAVLSNLIGTEDAEHIEVISNHVEIEPNGKWHIKYRHPSSGFGHDKSQAILPYRNLPNPPVLFFFGDGVSDMSAARHADVLFVKKLEEEESDLATYCDKENIPHILFEDFSQALPIVQAIVNGELTVEDALKIGQTY